jgi:hypothetical protein
MFPNKLATTPFQDFQVHFYCNDPYWYSRTQNATSIFLVSGGFTFPFSFPFQFGNYIGSTPMALVNSGDSTTPVQISINGPSVTPIITNTTTGQLIKCNITLNSGDVLLINTKFGSKSVTLISSSGATSNQMSTLDATSTFWQLAVGNNLVTFQDSTQGGLESCNIVWYNRFTGK